MSKAGEKIVRGAREALAYAQGACGTGARKGYRIHKVKVPGGVDVAAIRAGMKLTQQQFADQFGFSVANIRN